MSGENHDIVLQDVDAVLARLHEGAQLRRVPTEGGDVAWILMPEGARIPEAVAERVVSDRGVVRDKAPESPVEHKPGLFRRVGRGARGLGRLYVRAQFGDMKGFVQEQKSFGAWLMNAMRLRSDRRRETFEQAMQRLGLTEEDLAARRASLERMAWIYGVVAAIAFVFLVCSPWVEHALSQFLLSLGLFVLMGIRSATARFRVSQIRTRRLMGFVEWVKGEASDGRIAG